VSEKYVPTVIWVLQRLAFKCLAGDGLNTKKSVLWFSELRHLNVSG